ncbi:tyrosine-type recombinase/integrase [Nocardioides sp. LHG3406-4]|uniref:tyrosine-type recombinase/integrase n=1 Tax=Nocardioides sp. LHG3406-4 TaxID=2804575 RepID=UPI003CF34F89
MASRGAPVPTIDGVSSDVSGRGVLSHLRHRRSTGALARRVLPATQRPTGVPDPGLSHLQFEALLSAAKDSINTYDFALVTMLGLLGLRIFEATGSNIDDLGEEHGHRVLRVCGKGGKVVLVPLPPAVGRAIERAVDAREDGPILLTRRATRMDRHCATRRLRRLAETTGMELPRVHPHMLRHFRHHDVGCRGGPARRADRRMPRRSANHHALGPCPQEPRSPSQLHPRGLHGLRQLAKHPNVPR